jgi:hypothetical protein
MGAMHGKFFVRDARICGGGHSVPREGGCKGMDRGPRLAWPNLAGGGRVGGTVGWGASGEGVLD